MPPHFAYTDSATVNAAAVNGALALTYNIFDGSPMRDADLATMADSRDTTRCQLEMLRRANKLESTVLKAVNKAKKRALKLEWVVSDTVLAAKLQLVFSSNNKINCAQGMLAKGVDKKCAVVQTPPDAIFPGEGSEANPSLSEVEVCATAAARCEA